MELINNIFFYVVPFLAVLTTLVFVHEFGHFWVARRAGVKIDVFSIGFGKELFGFNDKHGTRWKFCIIPLGGYVKMFGDKSAASNSDAALVSSLSEQDKKLTFICKPLLSRAAIVAAGPIANYLLAIVIFATLFSIYGFPSSNGIVSDLLPNGPASKAGIIAGDNIVKLDNHEIKSFSDIQNVMATNVGEPVTLIITRGKENLNFKIEPQIFIDKDITGQELKTYKLGIVAKNITLEKVSFLSSIKLAGIECYNLSIMSLKGIGQIITGKRSSKELSGPIKIGQYAGKTAEQGFMALLWFVALLSVNLGLMNLLPIPVLDGGHLLILGIEALMGKKIASKIEGFGLQIGIILLIMLTMFVTINDLISLNLFKG